MKKKTRCAVAKCKAEATHIVTAAIEFERNGQHSVSYCNGFVDDLCGEHASECATALSGASNFASKVARAMRETLMAGYPGPIAFGPVIFYSWRKQLREAIERGNKPLAKLDRPDAAS